MGSRPLREPMSAEVLRIAARSPDAPARLTRAADAVLEGKFSWADVAEGTCRHPRAQALFSPRAKETVWPLLARVAAELNADDAKPGPAEAPPTRPLDDEDFSYRTYLRDWDAGLEHPTPSTRTRRTRRR